MEGVSDEILDFADETLAIPMFGFTKSFNVSVAAICMYELKQKLMKSGIDYKLSDQKLLEMKIRWTKILLNLRRRTFGKVLKG